jgi:hypothetical protein
MAAGPTAIGGHLVTLAAGPAGATTAVTLAGETMVVAGPVVPFLPPAARLLLGVVALAAGNQGALATATVVGKCLTLGALEVALAASQAILAVSGAARMEMVVAVGDASP